MSEDLKLKVRELVKLKEAKARTEHAFEAAKRDLRAFEAELFEQLEDSEIPSVKFDFEDLGVVRVTRRSTTYGRVLDKETLLQSLKDESLEDELSSPNINKARLNELVRERLESGQPLPEGADFYVNRGLTLSKK